MSLQAWFDCKGLPLATQIDCWRLAKLMLCPPEGLLFLGDLCRVLLPVGSRAGRDCYRKKKKSPFFPFASPKLPVQLARYDCVLVIVGGNFCPALQCSLQDPGKHSGDQFLGPRCGVASVV